MGLLRRDLFDRDDVPAIVAVGLDALSKAAAATRPAPGHHVRQQNGERLVADDLTCAPYGVTEAERRLLAGEARRAGRRKIVHQRIIFLALPRFFKCVLEFVGGIEVILDHSLVTTCDEDEMLDSGFPRFIHHVLKDRSVDDRQHLLGDGLGRRQEPGAKARDGQDGLANRLLHI